MNANPLVAIILIRPIISLLGAFFSERNTLAHASLFLMLYVGQRDSLDQAASIGESLSHGSFATIIDQAQRLGRPKALTPEREPQCEVS